MVVRRSVLVGVGGIAGVVLVSWMVVESLVVWGRKCVGEEDFKFFPGMGFRSSSFSSHRALYDIKKTRRGNRKGILAEGTETKSVNLNL